jgi:site-specific recombinase XerD
MRGVLSRDLSVLVVAPREYALAHVPRFLDSDQVRRVLAAIDSSTPVGLRDNAMVRLMLGLGLRRCEVAALRMADVDLAAGTLRIPAAKKSRIRLMALTSFETDALKAYLKIRPAPALDDHVFLRLVGPRPLKGISRIQISKRTERYLRGAGVQHGVCHRLRHTFAHRLLSQGAPVQTVQKLLGHQWGQTTRIYSKIRLEALREVAENDSLHF